MEPIVVVTTTETKEEAERLTKVILESKKGACVQVNEVESHYRWQGKIENTEEFRISIKTISRNFKELEGIIKENHSYDVPEIIAIPIIKISEDYKNWLEGESGGGNE